MASNYQLIAKNSVFLYVRLLVVAILGLFTSRVLLQTLGVRDFGLYTVVGGLVMMMLFFQNSMAGTTQRYLNYEMGMNNLHSHKEVFKACQIIHRGIAAVFILLAETFGLWFLNFMMNIHEDEKILANIIYQLSILTFIAGILNTPYRAAITSHEKMDVLAYINIAEAAAKFSIALLLYLSFFEKVVFYSFCILIINIIILLTYKLFAIRHFDECRTGGVATNKRKLKEISYFSFWANFEALGNLTHVQGIGLAINLFYGLVANAALGIANQAAGMVRQFTLSFMSALNPQIVHNFASHDIHSTHVLIAQGCKMGVFLVSLLTVPVFLEAPFLINLWLTEVPPYTITFVRLSMVMILFWSLSSPLITAQWATGNIRNFQIVMAVLSLSHLPLTLLFLKLGYKPPVALYIYIILTILKQVFRIEFVSHSTGLDKKEFYIDVVLRCCVMILLASIIPLLLHVYLDFSLVSSLVVIMAWLICIIPSFYYLSLRNREREFVKTFVSSMANSLMSKFN